MYLFIFEIFRRHIRRDAAALGKHRPVRRRQADVALRQQPAVDKRRSSCVVFIRRAPDVNGAWILAI